ncbi:DEAD/DEAH box helicase [Bradyrhizobium sp. G127]|jgi:superfamily II DNA/RNA helicase|uniref:DEAD/DEAH box helicase n=1 Tax=Bradyrhizobium sp. G127 TaxID=2904800 RepID=UPI001F464E6B|nr:DEAD/DEAH box helicase [Bradyrhizobium sp. G127]MCF2523490.1 DEAD/DEAH box helicase [Bradyrhizobium sp. G127]
MSFSNLGLSDKVLAAVAATGYTTPTPIQEQAIPHVLARRDVLGIAQTGTGKTAAFVLPMLTLLEKGRARARMPRTLILEPTRELAAQVKENFDKYGSGQKLNVALLIGGVSFGDQDTKLMRGVDVLIATPGRLLDHTERGGLLLTGVELLVIDEADRMLDMGFIPDIERICKLVPFTRQTLFFTATMPPEIRRITETFLHNPVKVEVSKPASTAVTVTQSQVAVGREPHEKREMLRQLLRDAKDLKNAIIFCNRKRDVAVVYKSLQKHGFSVGALHGDMDQSARTASLDQFRKGELPLLVASDVAARGLDIPEVSHVFNFDVPHHPDDYVHRIGRTGRAGRLGTAISIVSPADQKSVVAIEKLIGQPIARAEVTPVAGNEETPLPTRQPHAERSPEERKPRRDAQRARGGRNKPRKPEAAEKPVAPQAPSIGRAMPPVREQHTEPGDHSHLPAFLLRPVRARG